MSESGKSGISVTLCGHELGEPSKFTCKGSVMPIYSSGMSLDEVRDLLHGEYSGPYPLLEPGPVGYIETTGALTLKVVRTRLSKELDATIADAVLTMRTLPLVVQTEKRTHAIEVWVRSWTAREVVLTGVLWPGDITMEFSEETI